MTVPSPDASASAVRVERRGRIALIVVDNPPVNALSQAVRAGLLDAVRALRDDDGLDGGVVACAGRTFVSGADVREFGRPPADPPLPEVMAALDACPKPLAAALHGTPLGGGFEVALACHYRIAAPDTRMGLPETKLGVIPGAGGTQRLPRLVGVEAAAEMVASGRQVGAEEALRLGIVDRIAEGDVAEDAIAFLAERIAAGGPHPVVSARTAAPVPPETAARLLADATRRARGVEAPVEAVRAVLRSAEVPFDEGLAHERAAFLRLRDGEQSAALRHVFFARREAGKVPGLGDAAPREVRAVGVVGAGTMGAGIAVAYLEAGYAVTVVETDEAALRRGRDRIAGIHADLVSRGRAAEAAIAERDARLALAIGPEALGDADLVVEAAFEDMDVKRDLFARLGRVAKPGAVLATNTSYLDVDAIAAASGRPADCLGLHFFAPANVMRLLEVVRGAATAPDVLATGLAVGKRLGKTAVVAGVCDGFVGNRIWASLRRHYEYLMEDGAAPEEIDAAMVAYGFPMGPFAVFDLSGLDIAWAQRKRRAATRDPAERYVRVADRLCELGRFGRKTGAGWYAYPGGGKAVPDPLVAEILAEERAAKGIAPRPATAEAIQRRAVAAMANEAAKILEEGIALRPSDVDLVMIDGYGFPAHRGGPLFQADRIGLPEVLREVEAAAAAGGAGSEPSALLRRLAAEGGSFGAWAASRG
jgi:3-hydroxyacyl-CoA dehydrogenase